MGERDGGLIADLDRLLNRGVDPEGDGELLARFGTNGDHDAFAALVMRHGPMVRGVCRRLLRDSNDADDAFQATFLVLARKGGSLRDPDRLGPWLYGVASRVAAKARARSAGRKDRPLTDDIPARGESPAEWSDVPPILDAELSRLPSKQRDVLVACLLGGASEQEAARSFGCPVGTIKSRLSRGRETLRARLVRRGVAPATALAAASSTASLASSLPLDLIRTAVGAASVKAEVAPAVAALMKGAVPLMTLKAIVPTLALLLAGGLGITATARGWISEPREAAVVPPKPTGASASIKVSQEAETKVKNLKRLLLAMHNFAGASADNRLPSQFYGGPEGRGNLSWRVALLPYMGEDALYKKFHLDEAWDSPNNLALIQEMPALFQTPDAPAPKGQTRFQGFWGPGAVFDPTMSYRTSSGRTRQPPLPRNLGVQFADIQDGTANTAFLAVAGYTVEWTRPRDISMSPRAAGLPPLDPSDPRGLVVGMVDGSVHFLREKPDRPQFLLAIISRAGGEVVNMASQTVETRAVAVPLVPPVEPIPGSPAFEVVAPAVIVSPTLEKRLERVEEKLDQILKRLDGLKP